MAEAAVIGNASGAPPQQQMLPAHYQCLAGRDRIEVKEKVNMIEAITAALGCEIEMGNKYRIFDESGSQELFYAVEETDCCTRQLKQCFPDCAPWNLNILYTQQGNSLAFKLSRPCTCTCCCFNRPRIEVTDEITRETVGSIIDPCACCNLTFDLRDAQDETVLQANGGCCQCGLLCPLPCGPCAYVEFPIYDPKTGNEVAKVTKEVPSCCKWCCAPDVQNYKVEFGKVTDLKHKVLVMALPIFIDFRFFNDNENDDGRLTE